MKTNRILTLCLAGLLLTGSGISFTSCQGDDVDTNQFTRVRWHVEANSASSAAV